MASDKLLLNDGTSNLLLNDGTSVLLLNSVTGEGGIEISGTHPVADLRGLGLGRKRQPRKTSLRVSG